MKLMKWDPKRPLLTGKRLDVLFPQDPQGRTEISFPTRNNSVQGENSYSSRLKQTLIPLRSFLISPHTLTFQWCDEAELLSEVTLVTRGIALLKQVLDWMVLYVSGMQPHLRVNLSSFGLVAEP